MSQKTKCKVCGDETEVIFNIKFKAVNICESCARSIFIQQADWYIKCNCTPKDEE